MKILYISCHAILEYDEVRLLNELGYDIFSAGAYSNPAGHPTLPRPGIPNLPHYPELEHSASTINAMGGAIPEDLIDWADTIIFMHQPEWIEKNWDKIKHKRVILRTIGQLVSHQERMLQRLVSEGLQILRYSPKEKNTPNYAGEVDMIRFYKDPNEYTGYTGAVAKPINMTQSFNQRGEFVFRNELLSVMSPFPYTIFGIGNEDLGEKWGGELDPLMQREVLRTYRCFVYGGTYPAAYTLSLIEAMMTGMPIIALGSNYGKTRFECFDYYEIEDLIINGVEGFVSNDLQVLRNAVELMLTSKESAQVISENGRARAIELFGKDRIALQWQHFLG